MIPRATYRLQLNKDFTFADATEQVDYLARLGISHIYASPILTAREGSLHGYDVVDPSHVNPELGGENGLRALVQALRRHGMGLIVDIVPNHMAVGHADNAWWLDVLQHGRASIHAKAFDIDWNAPDLQDRILAPFLGAPPQQAIERGELKLLRDAALGKICFGYFDHRFPLRPEDQASLRDTDLEKLTADALFELLQRQHFVLSEWQQADTRINWRRFFDITELAALRMEDEAVFEAVHAKIFELYGAGLIDGVRVDHVDGLADPRAYCRHLHRRLAALAAQRPDSNPAPYMIVEKILAPDEQLPADWLVDGTTGYDFMSQVSTLQHVEDDGTLDSLWQRYGKRSDDFEAEEIAARREIIDSKFAAQFDTMLRAFAAAASSTTPPNDLRLALHSLLTHLRCYRSYATGKADSPGPGPYLQAAIGKTIEAEPLLAGAVSAIESIFNARDGRPETIEAIRRFNQLAATCAAKAVEDTGFYRYGRLLSRNDVGFDPRQRSIDIVSFHALMAERARHWPHAMLATATHDHKRGEDARARLAVLSEMPELWLDTVSRWFPDNTALRPAGLHSADEYQLYQSLIGVWPRAGDERDTIGPRLEQWCEKFLREGKLRSTWAKPDSDYEAKLKRFARTLAAEPEGGVFRASLEDFIARIEPAALANNITQAVLRCTLPGVPDLYQGCEYWDFSLVDPDNRRPVNYQARQASLGRSADSQTPAFKQNVIAALLQARRSHERLFRDGAYRPLDVAGERAAHVLAFERRLGDVRLIVAVGLHLAGVSNTGWGDTSIELGVERECRDVLAGGRVTVGSRIKLSQVFDRLPACVLLSD